MSNDDYYDDDEEFIPPTEEELKAMEEKRRKSDLISAELGRRMLLGWGLMGSSCPTEGCFTPLMKEPKTTKLFCVNCNVYVIPEEEYDPSIHTIAPPAAPVAKENKTASSSSPIVSQKPAFAQEDIIRAKQPQEAPRTTNTHVSPPPAQTPAQPASEFPTKTHSTQAASSSSQYSAPYATSSSEDPFYLAHETAIQSLRLLSMRLAKANQEIEQLTDNSMSVTNKYAEVCDVTAKAMSSLTRLVKDLA